MLNTLSIPRLTDRLAELGFQYQRPNRWTGPDAILTTEGDWLCLTTRRRAKDASSSPAGLWKQRPGTGREKARVFEAPLEAIVERIDDVGLDDQPGVETVSLLTAWAIDTLDGGVSDDWTPPSTDRLDELVPATALTFRAGSFIEPARLISDDRTLRVQVTLGRIDPTISTARLKWVKRLVADSDRIRLARLELCRTDDGQASIEAAIDLTGAPPAIAEALLPIAVDALRHCFTFLVPITTLIGDARCSSRVLETEPTRLVLFK